MNPVWRAVDWRRYMPVVIALLVFGAYAWTAAPSVLSGDSAELQLASATLGVAHPTTYPLFTMLGHLAIRLAPFGDLARRVTLVSALCGALAVGTLAALTLRLGAGQRAAVLAALLLAVTPGFWNAATVAEVYTLLALLILALGVLLLTDARQPSRGVLLAAGLVAGLGFTHHGLFTITALPLFGMFLLWRWLARPRRRWEIITAVGVSALGLLVWLYPAALFVRYGPFSGENYGLPQHYFWGAPATWRDVFDLVTGGAMRRGIFRPPTFATVYATFVMLASRATFEFGPLGLVLGLIGWVAMLRHNRLAWACAMWVFLATLAYLLLLGPAVQDAPVFTLPMLLPWAVWVAFGCQALLTAADTFWHRERRHAEAHAPREQARVVMQARPGALRASQVVFALLLATALVWADTRVEYASKRNLLLYREFGEAVLDALPPNAVVMAHWEQGMAIQYLHLVEQRRIDVWVDVVEPGDDPWGPRARSRYAGREVYLVGDARDVEGLPVELVRADSYAMLFRLHDERR